MVFLVKRTLWTQVLEPHAFITNSGLWIFYARPPRNTGQVVDEYDKATLNIWPTILTWRAPTTVGVTFPSSTITCLRVDTITEGN
ncbi:uncharacterized protein BCR38DRAFT_479531 [Pseudomassariella vexata]|uniref:Uncharacterized protein n=1 Tax=Pseudomassariella vexata TaxID=1141098 RepID=A0A1Y2EHF5_9PEZI|nr:uncharacterized protein BCR38DRAFT_479531 [Pseudomassariella vexata]ORY71001.1 hypothetical protein BCR38DRAFT_479531 [Pseudomassariella vexata]